MSAWLPDTRLRTLALSFAAQDITVIFYFDGEHYCVEWRDGKSHKVVEQPKEADSAAMRRLAYIAFGMTLVCADEKKKGRRR